MSEHQSFNPESEKKREIQPVTAEYLAKVFSSPGFGRLLNKVAATTRQQGLEHAFLLFRDFYSSKLYPLVEEVGATDQASVDVDEIEQLYKAGEKQGRKLFPFVSAHFHPDDLGDELIMPSVGVMLEPGVGDAGGDLVSLSGLQYNLDVLNYNPAYDGSLEGGLVVPQRPEFEYYPILLVGQVDAALNKQILLVQQRFTGHLVDMKELGAGLDSDLDHCQTQDEVVALLRQYGYHAEMARFTSEGLIDPSDLAVLESFTYTPSINPL